MGNNTPPRPPKLEYTQMTSQYLALHQRSILAQGSLEHLVTQVKSIDQNIEPIVVDAETCKRINIDWQGDAQTVLDKLSPKDAGTSNKRGRPKLGVKAKEVTLLPRHWDWLATQRGGASATLRRLVEEARKNAKPEDIICMQQQQLDGFMLVIFGDEPGFEEASRALYRNSKVSFETAIASWPDELKTFVLGKFNTLSALHNGEV